MERFDVSPIKINHLAFKLSKSDAQAIENMGFFQNQSTKMTNPSPSSIRLPHNHRQLNRLNAKR